MGPGSEGRRLVGAERGLRGAGLSPRPVMSWGNAGSPVGQGPCPRARGRETVWSGTGGGGWGFPWGTMRSGAGAVRPLSRAVLGTPSPAGTARPSRPPRSRRLAGACAAAGRRECLTRSFPRPSRAGNGLVSSYTPYIARTGPGRAGARWPPALQPLPPPGWEPAVPSEGCRGHRAPETGPVPCLAAAGGRSWGGLEGPGSSFQVRVGPSVWSLGRLTAVSSPGRQGSTRIPSPVRRWARSQPASARPAAGAPAWLLCQAPQVASCSSCTVAASSPGKNTSGSHPKPAAASLWSEMVSAFSSLSFWAPERG